MCGRFTLRASPEEVARVFELDPETLPDLSPRFNIAPTQPVAIVRRRDGAGARELVRVRWGLVPHWVKDPSDWPTLINARGETVAEKPSFRDAFRLRRCLVPADGFYEWVRVNGRKQPFFVRFRDDRPFAFAGLWERREDENGPLESCTILTTGPNDVVERLHDRMPVILGEAERDAWLDPAGPPLLSDILAPYPADEMEAHPVDRKVNDPSHDAPDCVRPLTA